MLRSVDSGVLNVAYLESGDAGGWPVILLHGFPYDVHAYDAVAPLLAKAGARVIVPYLRGYGPTRFRSERTPRSGEQAALGKDLLDLLDTLDIESAVLAGYDWGGRAACVVAALWPERVSALVSQNGYNIQNIADSDQPGPPENERRRWYQYYFHSNRGKLGLTNDRRALCRFLWQTWSPEWHFSDATFEQSATSFDNPDFVEVVIHSYRHRYGLVPSDPALVEIENRLAAQPPITVPTISLDGDADGVHALGGVARQAAHFSGPYEQRTISHGGHNLPQETPDGFAQAILAAYAGRRPGQ